MGFLSTGAWSVGRGVTSPSQAKVELKLAVMAQSSECVMVADSTKYGSVSTYRVAAQGLLVGPSSGMAVAAALDRLDVLVTDDGLADDTADSISQLGIDLRIVPVDRPVTTGAPDSPGERTGRLA